MGVRLDGVNDALQHATTRAAFNGELVTWLVWLRIPTGATNAVFDRILSVGEFGTGNGGLDIEIDGDTTQLSGRVWSGTDSSQVGANTTTTPDTWHAFVIRSRMTAGLEESRLFKDGSSVSVITDPRSLEAASVALGALNSNLADENAEVDVAEVAVWSSFLSDANIASLFNGGSGGNGASPSDIDSANLVSHWRLTDNTDLTDIVSGFDLTATGGVASTTHPPVDAPSAGGTTVSVDAAPVLAHAPDVAATAGQVSRTIGSTPLIFHAPAVTAGTGTQTTTLGSAPVVAHAPAVQVLQEVSFEFDVPTEHVASVSSTLEAGSVIFHAPAVVVAGVAQTRGVGSGQVVAHAPQVQTQAGSVSRTVGSAGVVLHAPQAEANTSVTREVGSAEVVAHAPQVTVATGEVTRTVGSGPVILHAPEVANAFISFSQDVSIGVASMLAHAPELRNAYAIVYPRPPLNVDMDDLRTTVSLDDLTTTVELF